MDIINAEPERLAAVEFLIHKTITDIYPHYYPAGATAFFLAHHSGDAMMKDIRAGQVFLLIDKENLLGTVTVRGCEISRLFVLSEHQGKGLGRMLTAFSEDKISGDFDEILLDASLPAKPFYHKLGYTEIETHAVLTDNGDYLCYDVMRKRLPSASETVSGADAEDVQTVTPIARIRSEFTEKFGIPRQSGLVDDLSADIIFEPKYRNVDALKGMEAYSHLWVIWGFSKNRQASWSPTVRPPRLGGNRRMGVFATRSPFRPNGLGLSCVRLEGVERTGHGAVLHIKGADMLDNTPIYDIKPYLPYVDSHPDALEGFAGKVRDYALKVRCPENYLLQIPSEYQKTILALLAQDPRPSYQYDPERIYGMQYAGYNIRFSVNGAVLTVCGVEKPKI